MKKLPILAVSIFSIAASEGAVTLSAEADTYIHQGNPAANFGSSTTLVSTNDGGSLISKSKDYLSLIRFNLSTVTDLSAMATLSLTKTTSDLVDFEIYGINDGSGDENFDEAALTFTNSDTGTTANEGSINTTNLTLLGSFSALATDGTVSFSSTVMQTFLSADSNDLATFVIYRTTQSGALSNFASSEAASGQPTLTFIPEPGTAILSSVALGFLMLGRKRA